MQFQQIQNVAILGGGERTSRIGVNFLLRAKRPMRVRMHVPPERVKATTQRIALAKHDFGIEWPDVSLATLEVVPDLTVAPDTDLVLDCIGRRVQKVEGVDQRPLLCERYCSSLDPQAAIRLAYTAAFNDNRDPQPGAEPRGEFHFLVPADSIALIEVGMSGYEPCAREAVAEFFRSAGYFPVVKERWLGGFLSNLFAVRLLSAVADILDQHDVITRELSASVDSSIGTVVLKLYRSLLKHPDGVGVFASVAAQREKFFEKKPEHAPLWDVFTAVWEELLPYLSEREVALGLLAGPALRCVFPGFLRTIDLLGVSAWGRLAMQVHPGGSTDVVMRLITDSRTGFNYDPFPYRDQGWHVWGGFYPGASPKEPVPLTEHRQVLFDQHAFFQRHRNRLDRLFELEPAHSS